MFPSDKRVHRSGIYKTPFANKVTWGYLQVMNCGGGTIQTTTNRNVQQLEGKNKLWYIHIINYHLDIKRNDLLLHATTQIKL